MNSVLPNYYKFIIIILLLFINLTATDLVPKNVGFTPPSGTGFIGDEVYVSFEIHNENVVTALANEWIAGVRVLDPFGTQIYNESIQGVDLAPFQSVGFSMALPFIPQFAGTYTVTVYNQYAFEVNPGNDNLQLPYIVNLSPENIIILFPENGATDIPISPPPTLEWTNGGTPISETSIFFGTTPSSVDPNTAPPLTNTINPITQFTPPGPLTSETDYYWAVRQENPSGITDNGPFGFRTEVVEDPCPQDPPIIIFPSDGATEIFDYPTTLTWQNPGTGEWTQTDIFLGTTPEDIDPNTALALTSTTNVSTSFSFERGVLDPNTTYFIRVGSICDGGSIFSEVTQFTTGTDCNLPGPPEITSPQNGETGVLINPTTITWNNPDGSWNNTHVYISPTLEGIDPNFADPITSTLPHSVSSFDVPSDFFQPNTEYYLRLGLVCNDGAIFTDPLTFETGAVNCPDPLGVLMPANGTMNFPFNPVPIEIQQLSLQSSQPIEIQLFLGTSLNSVDPLLSTPVTATTNLETTTFLLDPPLDPDTEYFVRTVLNCEDNLILGEINQFTTAPAASLAGQTAKVYGGTSTEVIPIELVQLNLTGTVTFPNTDIYEIQKDISSGEDGNYIFQSLPPGDYQLNVTPPENWMIQSPSESFFDIFVEVGANITELDFLLIPPPSEITGEKWLDENQDGNKDGDEDKIPDWPVSLTGNSYAGSTLNLSTTTSASGMYSFAEVPPGNYTISEGTVEGWIQTYPSSGVHEIQVDDGIPVNDLDFGNYPTGSSISGRKFFDINKNGTLDPDELGINNWVIQLFSGSGQLIAEQKTYTRDLDGSGNLDPRTEFGWFLFNGLSPGNYVVREVQKDGWEQTVPVNNEYSVSLSAGQNINNLNFGNHFDELDWGDLPEPADTTFGSCPPGEQCYETLPPLGARHAAVGARLGELRDTEPVGIPSVFADGDDSTSTADEDGVQFINFVPGVSGEVEVTITGDPDDFPTYLAAWIDFNGNGRFEPLEGELVIDDEIDAEGTYTYTFAIPDLIVGAGYARFRLGTDLQTLFGPVWFGFSQDGEVEDYVGLGFDYGDANRHFDNDHPYFPYGYPVMLVDNGARHIATPTTFLGSVLTDKDNDGQPSIFATGDDINDRDDEDGIELIDGYQIIYNGPNPHAPNKILTVYGFTQGREISFKPLATRTGFLNTWIDYNGDGHWDDFDEQIFDDEPIISGPDYTLLTFTVPEDAKVGWTYVRFRYSTVTNLEVTGPAKDGEVEDYLVAILPALDFGDAPTPYPTLFSDNGAFHVLSDWYLGELIDSELDGLPHPDAIGDNLENLDDEDGVTFLTPLTSGEVTRIEVKSNVPIGGSGYLSAWLDLDNNDIWEVSEQVIIDMELFGGLDTLSFIIPENAISGETFARFRFSNVMGLTPNEVFVFPSEITFNPGEVEDYKVVIDSLITDVGNELNPIPQEFNLYQNYPNPFNPSTIIRYDVIEPTHIRLDVYNILGQLVTTLVDRVQTAGKHEAKFETDNLSAGIYFYSIRMSNYVKTMKMILMK